MDCAFHSFSSRYCFSSIFFNFHIFGTPHPLGVWAVGDPWRIDETIDIKIFIPLVGMKMGGIKVYIPDELEQRFREAAMRLYGYGRGSLSVASEKAFSAWLSQVSEAIEVGVRRGSSGGYIWHALPC